MVGDSWSVLASIGDHHVRLIDNTIPGCLAWAARMRQDGWTVSEPERWPGFGETLELDYTAREEAA